jgi:hypothetical protein
MNKKEKLMVMLSILLLCVSVVMGIHGCALQNEIGQMDQYQEYLQEQIEKEKQRAREIISVNSTL